MAPPRSVTSKQPGRTIGREPMALDLRRKRVTPTLALALTAPIWNNLLQLLPERVRRASAAIGVTLFASMSAAWLAIREGVDLLSGLRDALPSLALALIVIVMAIVALRYVPGVVRHMRDRHIGAMTTRQFVLYSVIRVPLATALAEELVFRGLVWFAIESIAGPIVALVGSSLTFGLWHVGVSARQAAHLGYRTTGWVLMTVLATTLAGLGFGWLRLATGGIWAPFIAHCVINLVGAIGARIGSRQATGEGSQIRGQPQRI